MFRLFASAQAVACTGTWIQRTAQDWLVLELTGSPAAVGVAVALQCLPALVLGVWGGSVADRYRRRNVLIFCNALTGLLALALAVLTLGRHAQLQEVYALAVLLGVVSSVETPARQAYVTELVEHSRLSSAVSINSAGYQLGRLGGPAVAGVLIAVCGTGWTFGLCALISSVCLGIQFRVRPSQLLQSLATRRGQQRRWEAMHHVLTRPDLLWTFIMVGLMGILGTNFTVLLPAFCSQVFHADASGFGMLSALLASGSCTGALVAARLRGNPLKVLAASALALGVLEAAAALCTSLWPFGVLLVPIGLCAVAFSTTAQTAVQTGTEPELQGRISGLYVVVLLGGVAAGGPLTGALVSTVGTRMALIIAGLCCLALAALAAAMASRIRRCAHAPSHRAARSARPVRITFRTPPPLGRTKDSPRPAHRAG
ncbi:MFS transporter [Streptomyces sp. NBC_01619]|uniref:MFS transporter n=1 Tax=Streptomyces sp. NBC_01619 TaxID=2975901 RepID=UPI00224D27D3|nr:MFS transporter [Streptomyces sp. NBC_01619]MCX4515881.1 MFS transporter [Streptomyces sp. NBC_01619]